jgi:hypothetical protein
MSDRKFKTAFDVTAWFECGDQPFTNPSGNFDGQGLSWGPRQNCIGQGSLQPLLRKMFDEQPSLMVMSLGRLHAELKAICELGPTAEQLHLAITICNDAQGKLRPEWRSALAKLGAFVPIQNIFLEDARKSIPAVDTLAQWIAGANPVTIRHWALAYDFVTQNGGFNSVFKAAISTFLFTLAPFRKDPRDRMRAICWLRAGWTYIRGQRAFANDVLGRKLLIVEGRGRFRGSDVDLDAKFGITDEAG